MRGSGVADELRIVSVGGWSIQDLHLSAAEIVRQCGDAGLPVRWDIYGTGPLADAMRDSIDRHKVGQAVALKGTLPYSSFPHTVADYDLFIGMGTAALEAAMLGVPTIVATESEPRRTYGFIHELPFGNVGERQAIPPGHDLGDLVQLYAASSEQQRADLGRRGRDAVLGYTSSQCVEALDDLASHHPRPPSLRFKRGVSRLYEGMTASRLADLARSLRRSISNAQPTSDSR